MAVNKFGHVVAIYQCNTYLLCLRDPYGVVVPGVWGMGIPKFTIANRVLLR